MYARKDLTNIMELIATNDGRFPCNVDGVSCGFYEITVANAAAAGEFKLETKCPHLARIATKRPASSITLSIVPWGNIQKTATGANEDGFS